MSEYYLLQLQKSGYRSPSGLHAKLGVGRSPNSEIRWRNGYPKRVKVENFIYILRSSGPSRV